MDARGALSFAQEGDHIPFSVKRFFLLHDLAPGATRGGHAHRGQHQLLIMTAGAADVTVDDGKTRTAIRLERPDRALYAPPMLWLDLNDFTPDATCLVLASDFYSESDYIRDHGEFIRLTSES